MATVSARPRRVPLEELCRLPSFLAPAVSWAGDRLAYYADPTGRLELYVMDLATQAIRQVSHGEVPTSPRSQFVWDRDDRFIVFGKDLDGNEQHDLYRVEVATGAVTQLTSDPTAQEYPVQFSPDNAWLSVLTNTSRPESPDRPGQLNLWKIRADGSDYQPLTNCPFPAFGGLWSPDGQWLAFMTNEDPANLRNQDGYLARADGSETRRVFHERAGSRETLSDWHPDGMRLAVGSDASGVNQVGILDLAGGATRWLSPAGVDESEARFSHDGRLLVCLRNSESRIRPVVYDVESGQGRELVLPDGEAAGSEFFDHDRALLITSTSDTSRPALLAYDLASDTCRTLLAPEYGTIDPAVFVESSHITYPSSDGLAIPALLFTPPHREGERMPALVHVHGGPTHQFFRGFDPFAQFLVDQGLVVLEPNPRGSTGYGVTFRDAALRDWGGMDLEDIAAGAAYLKQLPYVDPSRIVIFGGSYGGYMTFMAVTKKPDIWRAGVAWVGITDLQRMYAASMEHFKYFLREQMGDPVEDAALWADRSAINFAGDLKAKLLMVHGENDARCPVEQSRLFRDRLLELGRKEGVDFEYVELRDEGHGSSDIGQKIRTFTILGQYLERVLA
ncbi:MAG TPA: S9 family peptidase [Chloroflexota bacterium]|nr:S9 family peptidase [Chloroflexota bacterium]